MIYVTRTNEFGVYNYICTKDILDNRINELRARGCLITNEKGVVTATSAIRTEIYAYEMYMLLCD